MTDRTADFPTPVFFIDKHGAEVRIHTDVLHGTTIGPHERKTGDVAHSLLGQQVGNLAAIEVHTEHEAVVQ